MRTLESNSVSSFKKLPELKLTGLNLETRMLLISLFITALDAILAWGEYEHSSDWDPYFTIDMDNGQQIETAPNYCEAELDAEKSILRVMDDPDEADTEYWYLNVMEIKSIKINS